MAQPQGAHVAVAQPAHPEKLPLLWRLGRDFHAVFAGWSEGGWSEGIALFGHVDSARMSSRSTGAARAAERQAVGWRINAFLFRFAQCSTTNAEKESSHE